MSVLVFAEISDGKFKKATYEAVSYGRQVADMLGSKVVAIVIGNGADAAELGQYGAHVVKTIQTSDSFTADAYAAAVNASANEVSASTVIISNTYTGKSLAPRLAQLMGASLATNVVSMPDTSNGFQIKRSVFSGKAFAFVNLQRDKKVIANIPINFVGNAKGVKDGGKFISKMKSLKVKTFPKYLKEQIEVNVDNLELNGNIRVEDVNVPNYEILNSPRIPIASVTLTRQLKQDEAAAAPAAAAPAAAAPAAAPAAKK